MKNICELTGFSPTLLRAWERRYDFLSPDRLGGGHRVFDEDDLRVLLKVKKLLDQGQSVGQVAALGREQLLHTNESTACDLGDALGLAPNNLQIYRTTRYGGEELGISLRELASEEVGVVVSLYERVKAVYEFWLYTEGSPQTREALNRQMSALFSPELLSGVARLGGTGGSLSPLKRAALEDAKWGALGPLTKLKPEAGRFTETSVESIVLLARDHAKLLRNAFVDLDTNLRLADESPKAHATAGALRKVHQVCPHIESLLDWDGCYSSRCLETSAVDRVLYDFIRRLDRIGVRSAVLWVGPCNDHLLRWAFQFEGNDFPAHSEDDLATLAVSKSVGISCSAALEAGYLGSREGWAWFHWPVFNPPPGVKACQCEL